MSDKKDPFEPTIEEATMSSGLHQQGNQPILESMIEEKLNSVKGPTIDIRVPSGVSIDVTEVSKDIDTLSKKLGGTVTVNLSFTIKPK